MRKKKPYIVRYSFINNSINLIKKKFIIKVYSDLTATWKTCNPICLTCDLVNICTDCYANKNRVLDGNGNCVCKKGYYQNLNQECVKCKDNCVECTADNVCTVCDSSLNRELGSNDCLCKTGYYELLPNLYCFQKGICPTLCQECDNSGICTKCDATKHFVLKNSLCECETDYQLNQNTQTCEKICQPPCLTCISGTNQCESCTNDTFFIENQCISTCPLYYFQNKSTKTCDKCLVSGCKVCSISADKCDTCKEDYFYMGDTSCLLDCPPGYNPKVTDQNIKICEKICQPPCLTCISGTNQCETCTNDTFLKENQCISTCPQQYFQNKSTNTCDKCLVSGCKICSISADKCDTCKEGYFYMDDTSCLLDCPAGYDPSVTNNLKTCIKKPIVDTAVYFEVFQEGENKLRVKFRSKGAILIDQLNQNLVVNIPEIKYTKEILSNDEILITFKVNKQMNQIIKTNVTIQNAKALNVSVSSKPVEINIVNELSGDNKKANQAVTTASDVTSKVAQVAVIPLQITGNFQFIASLLDICQIIYIMYFLELDIPLNLQNFYEGLEEFKFPFVNFFEGLQEKHNIEYDSPIKFKEQGIQGFFLSNFGDNMSYAIIVIGVHLFVKFILRQVLFKRYEESLSKISRSILNPRFYLDLLWGLYLELALAVFLQVQVIQKAEYVEEGVNYSFFFISFFVMFIPGLLCYLITQKRFDWLTEPLEEEVNSKFYMIYLYFRKLYIVMVITLIKNAPLVQVILISLFHASTIVYIVLKKPYKSRSDNIRHLIQTLFFLLSTLLLIYFLKNDPSEDNNSIAYGWVVISSLAVIVLIDFIFFFVETVSSLKENFKKLVQKIKQIREFYKEKKNAKLQQMQISEGYIGDSEKQINSGQPQININGSRASPVKVNQYNLLAKVNKKNNNNSGSDLDEVSSSNTQGQNQSNQKQILKDEKLSIKDIQVEGLCFSSEVITSLKIPTKGYQKSSFTSQMNSEYKLKLSTNNLQTQNNETYTPQSQYGTQKPHSSELVPETESFQPTTNNL